MAARKKAAQKARERKERIRKEKHSYRSLPEAVKQAMEHPEILDLVTEIPGDTEVEAAPPPMPPGQEFAAERLSRRMHRLMEGKHFQSIDEANAELERLRESGALDPQDDQPWEMDDKERAQEYAYRAMEAESLDEIRRWSKRALELDPENVDALRSQALACSPDRAVRLAEMRKVCEKAEFLLGLERFERDKGHFYGILETRPYMRALEELAQMLDLEGRKLEAIQIRERMLELNSNDNQGVRYLLLGAYLEAGALEKAEALLEQFPKDVGAAFLWGKVLAEVLRGNEAEAAKALQEARRWNPHAEKYFSGRKPRPRVEFTSYRFGDETEAQVCAAEIGPAWDKYQNARQWLRSQGP